MRHIIQSVSIALLVVVAMLVVAATPATAHSGHGVSEGYTTSGYQAGERIGERFVTAGAIVVGHVERSLVPTALAGMGLKASTATGTDGPVLASVFRTVGMQTVPPLFGAIGAMAGLTVEAILQVEPFYDFDDHGYEQAIERLS